MNDLIVAEKIAQWQRLKAVVLDSVSSPITLLVYVLCRHVANPILTNTCLVICS